MFERSLVESNGLVASGTQKWTALGSLTMQCAVAGLLIAIPTLRPDVLPMISNVPRLAVPLPMKPPVVQQPRRVEASSSNAMNVPVSAPAATATRLFVFPHSGDVTDGPAPSLDTSPGMAWGLGAANVLSAVGTSVTPAVAIMRARVAGPVRVSKGVTDGMLLAPIQPVYPAIAKAAGIQGTVVLEAVISKAGRIESLRAMSGPQMLRGAALDAVQAARYRPYLLNGDAVEVQTTITVVFQIRG
jgi:protein TonB